MSEFGLESAFMPGAFEVKLRSQDCRSGFRRWVFLPPFLPSLSGTCGPDTPAWVTCPCPSCQEPGVFPAGSKARAHRRPIKGRVSPSVGRARSGPPDGVLLAPDADEQNEAQGGEGARPARLLPACKAPPSGSLFSPLSHINTRGFMLPRIPLLPQGGDALGQPTMQALKE